MGNAICCFKGEDIADADNRKASRKLAGSGLSRRYSDRVEPNHSTSDLLESSYSSGMSLTMPGATSRMNAGNKEPVHPISSSKFKRRGKEKLEYIKASVESHESYDGTRKSLSTTGAVPPVKVVKKTEADSFQADSEYPSNLTYSDISSGYLDKDDNRLSCELEGVKKNIVNEVSTGRDTEGTEANCKVNRKGKGYKNMLTSDQIHAVCDQDWKLALNMFQLKLEHVTRQEKSKAHYSTDFPSETSTTTVAQCQCRECATRHQVHHSRRKNIDHMVNFVDSDREIRGTISQDWKLGLQKFQLKLEDRNRERQKRSCKALY